MESLSGEHAGPTAVLTVSRHLQMPENTSASSLAFSVTHTGAIDRLNAP